MDEQNRENKNKAAAIDRPAIRFSKSYLIAMYTALAKLYGLKVRQKDNA